MGRCCRSPQSRAGSRWPRCGSPAGGASLRHGLRDFWALVDRFRPLDASPGHAKPGLRWLRPRTATALALFVIAGGAFAAKVIPSAISAAPAGDSNGTGGSGGSVGATGQGAVHGSSPFQGTPGSFGLHRHALADRVGGEQVPPGQRFDLADHQPDVGRPDQLIADQHQHLAGPDVDQPGPGSTSPSPTTSNSSPSEPSSGATGTPGAVTSSPDSTDPDSSGSVSPGAPAPPRWRQGHRRRADRGSLGLVHRAVSVALTEQQGDPQGGAAHAGPGPARPGHHQLRPDRAVHAALRPERGVVLGASRPCA